MDFLLHMARGFGIFLCLFAVSVCVGMLCSYYERES